MISLEICLCGPSWKAMTSRLGLTLFFSTAISLLLSTRPSPVQTWESSCEKIEFVLLDNRFGESGGATVTAAPVEILMAAITRLINATRGLENTRASVVEYRQSPAELNGVVVDEQNCDHFFDGIMAGSFMERWQSNCSVLCLMTCGASGLPAFSAAAQGIVWFRQQSIRDYSRLPDAFVERALRTYNSHDPRDIPSTETHSKMQKM